jgi:hypothetical protein
MASNAVETLTNGLTALSVDDEQLGMIEGLHMGLAEHSPPASPAPSVKDEQLEMIEELHMDLADYSPPASPASSSSTDSNAIQLASRIDLNTLVEVFRVNGDQRAFSRCTFSFIDADDRVFSGVARRRKWDLTTQQFRDALRRVPDREVYPPPPPALTVTAQRSNCFFIKRPNLASYDDVRGTDYLARLMRHEMATLEHLRRNPHPGLARYHGCLVARGRAVGIVLTRYQATLDGWLRRGAQPEGFRAARCMRDIRAAVEHLHALGYAHNDLNPFNIMVDEDDEVVVIDFGSCAPFGKRLMSTGTYGWIDEEFSTSEKRHDVAALDKIERWLDDAAAGRFRADDRPPEWAL